MPGREELSEILLGLNASLTRFNKMKVFSTNQTGEVLPYIQANLNPTEWSAMTVLHDIGESAMSELAYVCGFNASRTTRAVDTLVRLGLATRWNDQVNRRIVRVKPTEKGIQLTEDNNAAVKLNFFKLIENIPDEKMEELIGCYSKIIDAYVEYCGHCKNAIDFEHTLLSKVK